MSIVKLQSLDQAQGAMKRLAPGDVLIWRDWRVTLAASRNDRSFWIEGRGQVCNIKRRRGVNKAIGDLLGRLDAESK
jgi:hypothetical protein